MAPFKLAHACDQEPLKALEQLITQLTDVPANCPGLLYLNRAASVQCDAILAGLSQHLPTVQWTGVVADAVIADAHEYAERPAIVAMLMPLAPKTWQMFSGQQPLTEPSDIGGAASALIHVDPSSSGLPELIEDMAARVQTGYLFGGVTSGRTNGAEMIAHNERLAGGISGLALGTDVRLLSRVTQGCSPLAGKHVITECERQYVVELDGQPALDVLLKDLGVDDSTRQSTDGETLLNALPEQQLRRGLLVGLQNSSQGNNLGFGDYLVRNLIGIDPQNRMIAIGDEASKGDEMIFCTRDRDAARKDLIRVCTELRDEAESESLEICGAHFVSCIARGEALFGASGAETSLLAHNLPDVPIAGFYANGEVARERLYGYTGVLTLFVKPDES